MEHLYHILDAYFAPGILMGMALCMFALSIPQKAALRNYRRARYIMGSAYLLYALCIYLEYHVFGTEDDVTLMRPVILTIACFQAYLFTYTLITLIRLNDLSLRRLVIELCVIATMMALLWVAHLTFSPHAARWVFWICVVFYAALLVHYVVLFVREYRRYASQMDNYFSDEDSRRLRWVERSFYISLAVGVLALVYALLPVPAVAFVFMLVVLVFYAVFGVRFINYALQFNAIEPAITTATEVDDAPLEPAVLELMQRIDELMRQDKLFRKSDLSVSDIAQRLGENPRTVSAAINAGRQVNFKTYINEFRVEEAKRLLDEDSANRRTVDAIGAEAGFANRSSFYRVFKRSQGISPTDYRH